MKEETSPSLLEEVPGGDYVEAEGVGVGVDDE
jgi:hypothetical protein